MEFYWLNMVREFKMMHMIGYILDIIYQLEVVRSDSFVGSKDRCLRFLCEINLRTQTSRNDQSCQADTASKRWRSCTCPSRAGPSGTVREHALSSLLYVLKKLPLAD